MFASLTYDNAQFQLQSCIDIAQGRCFVQLALVPSQFSILEEVHQGLVVDLLLEDQQANHVLHRLMEQLVVLSNRYVAQKFTYKGFARFSEQVSVQAIAEVSSSTRSTTLNSLTQNAHATLQYTVDENRRPILSDSHYSKQLCTVLSRFEPLQGFKPVFKVFS